MNALALTEEKFRDWGDCNGDVEQRLTKDELLANISVYWFSETIHSSMRLYYEGRRRPLRFGKGERMNVPCGVIRFAKEAPFPPREWVERFYNIRRWSEHSTGGHFAAMEEPRTLSNDIRDFFTSLHGESKRETYNPQE